MGFSFSKSRYICYSWTLGKQQSECVSEHVCNPENSSACILYTVTTIHTAVRNEACAIQRMPHLQLYSHTNANNVHIWASSSASVGINCGKSGKLGCRFNLLSSSWSGGQRSWMMSRPSLRANNRLVSDQANSATAKFEALCCKVAQWEQINQTFRTIVRGQSAPLTLTQYQISTPDQGW